MANQSSGSSDSPGRSGRGRRAPTIDLSADEVRRGGEAAPGAGEPAAPAREEASAATERDSPAAESTSAAGGDRGGRRGADERQRAPEQVMPSAFAPRAASAGPAAAERSGPGRGALLSSLLVAALAGGLIVLGGLAVLDGTGLLPLAERGEDGAAQRGQVAALEEELAAARQAAELEREDLQTQIADLNERLADLAEAAPTPAEADPGLGEEVADLRAGLAQLRETLQAPSAPAALEELGERVERLEGVPDRIDELASRVDALRAAPGEAVADADLDRLAGRIGSMEDRSAELAQQVGSAASAGALEDVRSQLTAALQDAEAELGAALNDVRAGLGGLDQRLARLQAAVAADGLADAIFAGRPFATELQAVSRLGIDDPALSQLQAYAESGLPSRAQLRRQFSEVAQQIREADAPPPSDAGPFERLVQSARDIVEVRPAGPQAGDDAGAVASRIEGALANGNLGRALEEWDNLPPEAQAASQDWSEQARAVLAGEALAQRLRSDSLAQLAGRS